MQEKEPKIEYRKEREREEEKEDIFEREPLISDNFKIYYNNEIKKILEEGDDKKFDEVKKFVDRILGSKREMGDEKSRIYLFSDKEKYSKFLEKNFPNVAPEPATFDKESKSIFKYISILKKEEIEKYKDLLQRERVSENEIKNISRADIFSGVSHELGHLHPFFGGIGNKESENKWEQEMVCIFIGEKIRTKFGNERFRRHQFLEAQKELKKIHRENKKFSWEKIKNNWDNITMRESFVYPWLEKKYGLEKLQNLWQEIFKERKTIAEAIKDVYNRDINELEQTFEKDISEAKDFSGVEKLEVPIEKKKPKENKEAEEFKELEEKIKAKEEKEIERVREEIAAKGEK